MGRWSSYSASKVTGERKRANLIWKILTVGTFLLFAVPLLVLKTRATRREKCKLLAQSGNPTIIAEAIRRDLVPGHRYLFLSSLPWVEVRDSTAIVHFDTRSPVARNGSYGARFKYQNYNRNLFRRGSFLLASVLGMSIPFDLISTVIVSAYETRQDRMGDIHKICVLSLHATCDIMTPSYSRAKGKEDEFDFDVRFNPNKDFILREVAPFESDFDRHDVIVELARESVRPLEEIQSLSLPGLRKLVKQVLSDMEYEVNEIPIVGRGDKGHMRGNLVEKVFFNMGHVKGKGVSTRREVDMVAKKDGETVGVGCIVSHHPVEQRAAEEFYRALKQRGIERGYFVTNNMFSLQAIAWADNKLIELIDRKKLKDLLDSLAGKEKEIAEVEKGAEEALPAGSFIGPTHPVVPAVSERESGGEDEDVASVTQIPQVKQAKRESEEVEKQAALSEDLQSPEETSKDEVRQLAEEKESRDEVTSSEPVSDLPEDTGIWETKMEEEARRIAEGKEKGKEEEEEEEEEEVTEEEKPQMGQMRPRIYLTTTKCSKCGWTFEHSLGGCPHCEDRSLGRLLAEREYLKDERRMN